MIRIRYQKSMLVVEYCSSLLEGNSMLFGIRCRLAGIPIRRRFRSYVNEQYNILLIAARHIFCLTLKDSRRAQRGWLVRLVELSRCAAL